MFFCRIQCIYIHCIINSLEGKFHTEGNCIPAEISLCIHMCIGKILGEFIFAMFSKEQKKNHINFAYMRNVEHSQQICHSTVCCRVFDTFVLIQFPPPPCLFLV